jgi:hypothetical protein
MNELYEIDQFIIQMFFHLDKLQDLQVELKISVHDEVIHVHYWTIDQHSVGEPIGMDNFENEALLVVVSLSMFLRLRIELQL